MRMTNTQNFKHLAEDASERNRAPKTELLDRLDPEGVHLTSQQIPHGIYAHNAFRLAQQRREGGTELRSVWLVKVTGSLKPVEVIMDNSFAAIETLTVDCAEADALARSRDEEGQV